MKRFLGFAVAMFFALVAIALVGGDSGAVAGHGCHGRHRERCHGGLLAKHRAKKAARCHGEAAAAPAADCGSCGGEVAADCGSCGGEAAADCGSCGGDMVGGEVVSGGCAGGDCGGGAVISEGVPTEAAAPVAPAAPAAPAAGT
jgi:hypothetical protein